MKHACRLCNVELDNEQDPGYIITGGICPTCSRMLLRDAGSLKELLDRLEEPILVLQSDPRQVRAANQKACRLFKKELSQVEGYRGGQVLGCVHACSEAGCGIDINCVNCEIKNAVVETFAAGKSFVGVSASLHIKRDGEINPYNLEISTEKVGDLAFVRIDRYKRESDAPEKPADWARRNYVQ